VEKKGDKWGNEIEQKNEKMRQGESRNAAGSSYKDNKGGSANRQFSSSGRTGTCHRCGREGHFAAKCRIPFEKINKGPVLRERSEVEKNVEVAVNTARREHQERNAGRPYWRVEMYGEGMRCSFNALLDTGAEMSLMTQGVVERLEQHGMVFERQGRVAKITSPIGSWQSSEIILANLIIDGGLHPVEFAVIQRETELTLLGNSDVRSIGISIDNALNGAYEWNFEVTSQVNERQTSIEEEFSDVLVDKLLEAGLLAVDAVSLGPLKKGSQRITKPIQYYRIETTPKRYEFGREELVRMLRSGAIEKVPSDKIDQVWISPVVIANKGDSYRFCVNFSIINDSFEMITYPIPRISELLREVSGAEVLSKFDLKSGFWQLPLRPKEWK